MRHGFARVAYLFLWVLGLGVALVYLRTHHLQCVNRWTDLRQQRQQVAGEIRRQQQQIVAQLQAPESVRQRVLIQELQVVAPGEIVQSAQGSRIAYRQSVDQQTAVE